MKIIKMVKTKTGEESVFDPQTEGGRLSVIGELFAIEEGETLKVSVIDMSREEFVGFFGSKKEEI